LTKADLLDKVNAILPTTSVKQVFVFGADTTANAFACLLQENKAIKFKPVSINPQQDIAVLPYSSGTTGLAKGVMLSHYNLVAHNIQVEAHKDSSYPNKQDCMIAVLPFFHIFGMTVNMNLGLSNGATLVIANGFKPKKFLSLIEQYRVSRAYLVPPIILFLAENPIVADYDVSSLQYILSGAAPLGKELVMTVRERIECRVCQGYGLTETSPVTHWTPDLSSTDKSSSVGTLVPNTEAQIIDTTTGRALGYNEAGEILLRGPQVMLGYLYNLDATAATLDLNGWLHTGDVASVDEEGYFYIIDRLKELIKCRGYQVAPAELEQLLLTHPAIVDAAVIPKLDKKSGEVPKAFVVTKQEISADEIINWAAKKVASYKRIKEIEFIDQIPKSPSGKILRRLLRNR
jgi:acyl-CoA synthetase (AMP-forming)/AMP-acid ligase II